MRREVLSMTVIEYNSVQNSSFVDPGCSEMEVFGQADSRTQGKKSHALCVDCHLRPNEWGYMLSTCYITYTRQTSWPDTCQRRAVTHMSHRHLGLQSRKRLHMSHMRHRWVRSLFSLNDLTLARLRLTVWRSLLTHRYSWSARTFDSGNIKDSD